VVTKTQCRKKKEILFLFTGPATAQKKESSLFLNSLEFQLDSSLK
jgi:hypothetical protein